MLKFVLIALGIVICGLIFTVLQRRFSSKTLAASLTNEGKEAASSVSKSQKKPRKKAKKEG